MFFLTTFNYNSKAHKSIIPKQSETSPLFPDKHHDMVPHSGTERRGARNPKLWAAPESNSMVVEHRWYDHSPIKDGTDQKRVPQLAYLIAKTTMRRVPEEALVGNGKMGTERCGGKRRGGKRGERGEIKKDEGEW
jgi:hypothetical protein